MTGPGSSALHAFRLLGAALTSSFPESTRRRRGGCRSCDIRPCEFDRILSPGRQAPCPCPEHEHAPASQWHPPSAASVWQAMPSDSEDGTFSVGFRPKKP